MSRIDSWHRKISTGCHFQNGHCNTAQIQHCLISTSWIDSRHRIISTGLHFQNGHHNTTKIQHCSILIYFLNQLSVAGLGDFIILWLYRITGNFCGVKFLRFWSKKMTFNFCGFYFLRLENLGTEKKKILYYKKQQLKWCCDKQLVHITVILRSKHIFSSFESFQTLQPQALVSGKKIIPR
jgi:hypothetical protein